jgi:diaminopimelate epimerase
MGIPFLKMQGLGNDFVVIDDLGKPEGLRQRIPPELAREICDRRFGVGADQILWLKTPQDASCDARMDILNADGSVAEMCGNGIRAAGLYLYRHGPKPKSGYRIETLGGIKDLEICKDGEGGARSVRVDMEKPLLQGGFPDQGERLMAGGQELRFFEVNMGNPHTVFFTDDVLGVPLERLGPLIETHARFPSRTNVEFVQVTGPSAIRVRVWERGAGITLACGTGACASAVASLATRRVSGTVEVELPGGLLKIRWNPGEPVFMEGPAEEVFRGVFEGNSARPNS